MLERATDLTVTPAGAAEIVLQTLGWVGQGLDIPSLERAADDVLESLHLPVDLFSHRAVVPSSLGDLVRVTGSRVGPTQRFPLCRTAHPGVPGIVASLSWVASR